MILVISSEQDISTDYFIEWCNYLHAKVVRINERDSLNITDCILIDNGRLDVTFNLKNEKIKLSQIRAVWFRRGHLFHFSQIQYHQDFANNVTDSVINFLENENKTLNDFIIHVLSKKRCISHPYNYNANKLITLLAATEVGLNIPKTLITQSGKEIISSFKEHDVITKSIQDALPVNAYGSTFSPGIHEIGSSVINETTKFYFSKIQMKVEKKYELRIFFIGNEYYAGAIFSGNNTTQNSVHKIVPFLLPHKVLDQLMQLNSKLGYNTGSIDMIVDHEDTFYFLEINPVGQYDYLSKHCNYNLDFKIASHLCQ